MWSLTVIINNLREKEGRAWIAALTFCSISYFKHMYMRFTFTQSVGLHESEYWGGGGEWIVYDSEYCLSLPVLVLVFILHIIQNPSHRHTGRGHIARVGGQASTEGRARISW